MNKGEPSVRKISGSERYERLISGPPQTQGLKSGCVSLEPGESVGAHNTESKEEAIIILEGKAQLSYGEGKSLIAESLSICYMPPYTQHDVKNVGQGALKYVFVVAPVTPIE